MYIFVKVQFLYFNERNLDGWTFSPKHRGVKKSADIGRTVSKPIKLSMSGKNIYPSLEPLKNKNKVLEEQNFNEMNHIAKVDCPNSMIEEMDTQDG